MFIRLAWYLRVPVPRGLAAARIATVHPLRRPLVQPRFYEAPLEVETWNAAMRPGGLLFSRAGARRLRARQGATNIRAFVIPAFGHEALSGPGATEGGW